MATVSIVIVNFNGETYQNDCIHSLYEMDYKDFEIIVVDNASTDNSVACLKSEFPQVKVIENHINTGVVGGNNIGIRYSISSGSEYTLLLNNDIVVSRQLLSELISRASEKTVVVPKIYYYEPSDLLWYAGGEFRWQKGDVRHTGMLEKDKGQYDKEGITPYASTCCMLVHNTVFHNVGIMDENYFMYYDDADFCVRLQKSGISIRYVPSAVMWHKVSSSTGGEHSKLTTYYLNRNQLYYMKKYKENISIMSYIYVICKGITKIILSPVRHKNDRYIFVAYIDFFRGRLGKKNWR